MSAASPKTFWQDDRGAILVFFAVSLVFLLGLVAMAYDLGQKAATQTELQSFADQVALAAAGELDGKADSITRATAAAANLIVDRQTFASGSQTLAGATDYTLTFYSTLPGSDTASLAAGVTTDPAEAIYVQARVTPRSVPFTFTGAFDVLRGGTSENRQIGAVAVAGFTQYACDITPLMFCIPTPNFRAADNIGRMIHLRAGGNGSAWGPGNYGFLDPSALKVDPAGPCAGLNGAQLATCLIGAADKLTQCFSQRGVETEPGQKVGLRNSAINVRFDMWSSVANGLRNDPVYAPAPNVIKGRKPRGGGNCIGSNGGDPTTDTLRLPRDNCFATSTCASGNRFGDGNWSAGRPDYVLKNYGGTDPSSDATAATTRYEYYLAEIAAAGGGASTTAILPAGRQETGRPICSRNQSPDPDRRVMIAAGIDCTANPINGRETNVPVHEFVKIFLTEPVSDSDNNFDMFVEVVGSAEAGSGSGGGGIIHDVVQLYR